MNRQLIDKYYNGVKCFHCGGEHIYRLSDGRIKCGSCLKRYSLSRLRNEFSALHYFSLEINCRKASNDLGLNYKTVYKIYKRLRLLLAEHCDSNIDTFRRDAEKISDHKRSNNLIIIERNEEISSFLITGAEPESVFNAMKLKNAHKFALYNTEKISLSNSFQLYGKYDPKKTDNVKQVDRIDGYWSYVKERLRGFHGIDKKNFSMYLKEIEFRYNNRRDNLYEKILTIYYGKNFSSKNTQIRKSKN